MEKLKEESRSFKVTTDILYLGIEDIAYDCKDLDNPRIQDFKYNAYQSIKNSSVVIYKNKKTRSYKVIKSRY